ncbi:MAG: efflux RND transporter permease subunit, partial [Candidatus Cloacimonetes bacterium]|nr:efflux RND transporter permease subunit [Candidatus Cloacimonadota bacterium]
IAKHKEVKHVVTNLGSQGYIDQGTNLAAVNVKLIDSSQRDFSSQDFVSTLMQELADIPNARLIVSAQMGVGGGGSPIEFYLQGQDNEQLELLKPEVMKLVSSVPGVQNLDTSTRTGKPELTVYPNREKMAEIGASVFDLAMALRLAIEGSVATQYREQGNEYDIKLSLNDDSVDSPEKIRNLSISINGNVYTLSQLADLDFASGVNKITHRDRYKTIQFTGGVTQGYNLGNITNEIKKVMEEIKLPPNYRFAWGGDASMLEETMVDMIRTFILAILLTYMLLAAILESFAQPLLIMSTVPLALIGVIFSLLITGVSINIFSMMAIIMLVGIVVNNAILILDYVNMKRREGVNSHDALIEAGKMKLKPIIMSTLSIVIGMMPMALGIGSAGKEFRQSMGIVSIGGLMVSTFLTLVIIPAFYYITTKNIGIDKRAETE